MTAFGFQLVLKQFTHANICKVKLLQLLTMNVLPPPKSSSSVVINIRREVKENSGRTDFTMKVNNTAISTEAM